MKAQKTEEQDLKGCFSSTDFIAAVLHNNPAMWLNIADIF